MNETDLMRLLIERAPHAILGIHVERRNILNVATVHGFRARNGIVGQADTFAIYRGLHLELETKAARGAMADAQRAWRRRCTESVVGPPLCPHLILRAAKGEEPSATVSRWIEELRSATAAP